MISRSDLPWARRRPRRVDRPWRPVPRVASRASRPTVARRRGLSHLGPCRPPPRRTRHRSPRNRGWRQRLDPPGAAPSCPGHRLRPAHRPRAVPRRPGPPTGHRPHPSRGTPGRRAELGCDRRCPPLPPRHDPPGDIDAELAGRPRSVRVRLAYLTQGVSPDLADRLLPEGEGGRAAPKVWFGPRGPLKRHSTRFSVADTLLPFDPATLRPAP